MSDETTENPTDVIDPNALLESLLKMVTEGSLTSPLWITDNEKCRWWYEDRDELIEEIKAHLQDSNRRMT
jgi:hypothetical protein